MPKGVGYIIDKIKSPTQDQLSDIVRDRAAKGVITEGKKKNRNAKKLAEHMKKKRLDANKRIKEPVSRPSDPAPQISNPIFRKKSNSIKEL